MRQANANDCRRKSLSVHHESLSIWTWQEAWETSRFHREIGCIPWNVTERASIPLSQRSVADLLNELLRERRAVSPEMALQLARLFGNSPEFWLNAQRAVDLWDAAQAIEKDIHKIRPISVA